MMYVHRSEDRGSSLRGRFPGLRGSLGFAGRAACVLAILCLPIAADGDGGAGGGQGGQGGQVSSGGDETVGTLPIIGRQGVKLPTIAGWRGMRPAFYLEGTLSDIQSSLYSARGDGYITIEVLDPSGDRIRAAFHGNVSVILDKGLLETSSIQTGLAVPATFAPETATLTPGTQPTRSLRLRAGVLPIAVGELASSHALDGHPLQLQAFGDAGRVQTTRVYAQRDKLILRQSY